MPPSKAYKHEQRYPCLIRQVSEGVKVKPSRSARDCVVASVEPVGCPVDPVDSAGGDPDDPVDPVGPPEDPIPPVEPVGEELPEFG